MKNKYLRLVVVLSALLLSVSSLWAERVTQEDAALVAANFLNGGDSTQGAQAPGRNRPIRRVTLAEDAQYYVYANADGNGWVMVAANDVVQPILAYSNEGEFRADKQPANIKSWLGKYNKQIKQAEADGVQATEEVKQEWKQLRKGVGIRKGTPVVAALIQTKWDQDAPYYNQCPQVGNSRCVTGCVATAMAQVMYYHKWPDTGTGSASVTVGSNTYTVDFSTGNYDWDNMLLKYNGYFPEGSSQWTTNGVSAGTTAQQNAVAKLMYHCGVAVEMDYGTDVSGAQTIYPNASQTSLKCAANALWNNFGYKTSTLKCYYRPGGYGYSAVNNTNWHNYLKTELDNARPIMYAGSDDEGGHSFICDGYDNTTPTRKYHFNWGWSGYCDGYYDVDDLVPGTGGSGAGNGSYNDDQDIIIGIIPDKPNITITWSVQGNTTTTTQTSGTLVLPATTPSDCSGANGKKFVGWTESSSVSGSAPADLFTSGSGKTVTENKTYYAVYATETTSPAPRRAKAGTSEVASVTFANASSDGTADKSSSISDLVSSASGISSYSGSKVYAGTTGVKIGSGSATGSVTITLSSSATVKEVKVTAKKYGSDTGTLSVKAGSTAIGEAQSPPASAGELTFTAETAVEDVTTITVATSSKRAYISSITVYEETSGGGGGGSSATYSDYSLSCGAACTNTPTMSFSAPTTVSKTTADGSFTKAVTISGKGNGQTVAYSSSDETVATVNSSGVVTLKGKVGSTTITASVEANGTYCPASASYTINVTAAPINVTLYYNNTSTTISNQTSPYTLPTGSPYNAAMCGGDWTFAGWYNTTYDKSTTAPTYITQLTATGYAYAVYTTTETTSGAPVRQKTAATATYTKVASGDVTDGQYLIVYEGGNVAFDGSLTTLDAASNTIAVTIDNSTITATNATEAAEFTIDASAGTILSASGYYIGATSNSNSLNSSTSTVYTNTLSIDNSGNAVILGSGGAYLRYNSTSGQTRFRYFKSSSYTSQQAIQLYKKSTSGGTTSTTYYATSPDCATPPPATDYTVTWEACGETFDSKGYASGAALTMPASTPSDNAGKEFVGWTATEHYTGATAPADLFTSAGSKTVTADVTYYAVFQ